MQIIVVYKVDRLTRALADFAKLVELFDAHGVSFVSVTQQFNTTSSMGRLTLNVLLSFAQFEREVIGERIRDKIAASKRKGLWMGGVVSFGYSPKGRTLVIKEGHASQVQEIYRLYVQTGCVRRTKEELDRRGWKIVHKGQLFQGQHQPIIDSSLWQAVQARLAANLQGHRTQRTAAAPSLLAGIVVDAMGNRLMPSHATKGARRYRYYVGPGRSNGAGSVLRIPAQELEQLVLKAVASLLARIFHQYLDLGSDEGIWRVVGGVAGTRRRTGYGWV